MAIRVFLELLYGKGHNYGNPLTGSRTESSVGKITPFGILDSNREDVQYESWRGHMLDRKMLELLRQF